MTGRGRALPPVRWLSELHCARVLRAGRVQRTSQTQVSPETPVWHHSLSCPQCAVYSLPTHPPPNPHPLNRIYLQCNRTPGPRAPARQMVVRITLCTCPEGREGTENQPNHPEPTRKYQEPSRAHQEIPGTIQSAPGNQEPSRAHQEIPGTIQSPPGNQEPSRAHQEIPGTIQSPPGNTRNHPEPTRKYQEPSRAHQEIPGGSGFCGDLKYAPKLR